MKKPTKNVWYMGLTSFLTDASSEMIFPILPLFLTSVLNANMAIIGLIEGIAESAAALLKLASGWISDKFGKKKPLVLLGYSLSTITKPFVALSTHWTHVLTFRVSDRIGKGIRTAPRDALIAASVNKKDYGKSFGLNRALDGLGAVVGTLLAFIILSNFVDNFRLVFWLSVIPAVLAIIVLYLGVKEVKGAVSKRFSFNFKDLDPNFKKFMLIMVFFNIANFSYAFFILRAQNIGVAVAIIPLVYLVYNISRTTISIPAGRIADKIGRKRVLTMGLFIFALTCFGFAFTANVVTIWILFALYGIFYAINDGVSRAYVSELVSEQKRGTALGAFSLVNGGLILISNSLGGLLWQKISVEAPFVFAAVLSLVSAVLLVIFIKK